MNERHIIETIMPIEFGLKLEREVNEARQGGYEVSIGHTEDIAYQNPEKIRDMYDKLDELGKEYKTRASALRLGAVATYDWSMQNPTQVVTKRFKSTYEHLKNPLENIREELLFDETKMSWHQQRGKAVALQTITDAHFLIPFDNPEGDGIYPTMSGKLDFNIETFRFDENDGNISNMSLEEAMITHYGTPSEVKNRRITESLTKLDTFLNAPVTQEFKDIVAYCYDSLGIRSRKQEVRQAVAGHIDTVLEQDSSKDEITLLSIGCGTAESILEVAFDVKKRGISPRIILLDQDPIALAAARTLAVKYDLAEAIEIHCNRLFDDKGNPFDMGSILNGRDIDVAEDTGLREYLPANIYTNLSKTIWNHLAPHGMITTGNMNKNRPQSEFLHGLMGWEPGVKMRRIKDGFRLHEASGIPKGNTRARVTRDGVYTLFFSYK